MNGVRDSTAREYRKETRRPDGIGPPRSESQGLGPRKGRRNPYPQKRETADRVRVAGSDPRLS
jgi:hypothetical protein